jgi:pimeloyl-ACP methyl ester carboxylesterase
MAVAASVMLVHGAFHGAWCWNTVVEGLRARGIEARAIDLPGHGESREPLGDMTEHGAALRRALQQTPGPVVVCGHSLGGATISEGVPLDGRVRHLVYVAAVMPDRDQTVGNSLPAGATSQMPAALQQDAAGNTVVAPDRAVEFFYHDCPPELAAWAVARLCPENPRAMTTPLAQAAWREIESTYVVCLQDRAIPPAAQEELAKRCAHVTRWDTSHSPMLSRPALLVDLLARLAA